MDNLSAAIYLGFTGLCIYAVYVFFAKEEDDEGNKKDHHDKSFATGFFVWFATLATVLFLLGVLKG